MAKKKGTGKTLVRCPDGTLYLISKTAAPVKLTAAEHKKARRILGRLEKKLKAVLTEEVSRLDAGCNQHVQIVVPDVPME